MIPSAKKILTATATVALTVLVSVNGAQAEPPVKLLIQSQYGAKINLNENDFCELSECKSTGAEGTTSQEGFASLSPKGVAVAPTGNIYAADDHNARVVEREPDGKFVLMFGKEVNETKTAEFKEPGNPHHVTETEENICTQVEIEALPVKAVCKAGSHGGGAGAFAKDGPFSLAVDPVSGFIYAADTENNRVNEYTATGEFLLMIGREVDKTKTVEFKEPGNPHHVTEVEENLCTASSDDVCQEGVKAQTGSIEHEAFLLGTNGNELAVGGPKQLLYVGDEHRVQEFEAGDGKFVKELPLTSISSEIASVNGIAVNQSSGTLYLSYYGGGTAQLTNVIFEFEENSERPVKEFILAPREKGAPLRIEGMALDDFGRLAVAEHESGQKGEIWYGSLLHVSTATGKPITGFTVLSGGVFSPTPGLGFNAENVEKGEEAYATAPLRNGIVGYTPKVVAEPVTGSLACSEEGVISPETSVMLKCEMNGQINPENVPETEVWFQWSNTEEALEGSETHETPREPIATGDTLVTVKPGVIVGQRPNERIYYELAGLDELEKAPELPFIGEEESPVTPLVPPRVVGQPSVSFVKSSSAVMAGTVNPENAATEYYFEYGPGNALAECSLGVRHENCVGVGTSSLAESAAYGKVATTLEATGLQPNTLYHYRLFAENESRDKNKKRTSFENPNPENEGQFTTAPAPVPQAEAGSASAVGTTSAIVSGFVNPDGQPASYHFELGKYNGVFTQYGIVFSGSVDASNGPVEERLALSGLHPGTEYAYRIFIQSGYGTAYGATETFATAGVPAVLPVESPLPQLEVPKIEFPKEPAKKTTTKKLTLAQQLTRALKACEKKPKAKRAACKVSARKKYAKKGKK